MKVTWKDSGRDTTITEGIYEIQIKSYRFNESLKGNPQITWEAKIIGPEDSPFIGRSVFEQTTLVEKAIWKLGWFVSALKIDTKILPEMDTNSEEFRRLLRACIGRRAWWSVAVDTWDGKKRNKVVDYEQSEDQPELSDVSQLEDVPDFIRRKLEGEGSEQAPF